MSNEMQKTKNTNANENFENNSCQEFSIWSQKISEKVITGANISIYWKDKNGIILGCNDYCCRLMGFESREQAIGINAYDLTDAATTKKNRKIDERVMKTGLTLQVEEKVKKTAEDKTRYFLTIKSPLLDEKGNVIGVKGYSQEITAYKMVLDQMMRAEMLKELERQQKTAVTIHAGGMSHDLKNSLHKAGLALEMVNISTQRLEKEQGSVPAEVKKINNYLQTVLQSHQDIRHLIDHSNRLIQQSTSDHPKLVLVNLSVSSLLQRILTRFNIEEEERTVFLDIQHQVQIPVDELAFTRIMINLIDNAKRQIKLKNKGKIYISSFYLDEKNPALGYCIEVKDTAGGLTLAEVEGIFERYKTKNVQGTGLGLQGVVQLMQQMNAKISTHLVDEDCIAFRLVFSQELEQYFL